MTDVQGTIYCLHFDQPFKHARHYLGFATDLDARIQAHRSGNGARLMEVVKQAGIGFQVVRTWTGTRRLERQLKNRGGAARICPVCRAAKKANAQETMPL